ncbi:MAG: hypothetical protein GY832_20615 [Chloroflexi bacterium]|nr:hypothetical protein [Chloroflexota bacterium]
MARYFDGNHAPLRHISTIVTLSIGLTLLACRFSSPSPTIAPVPTATSAYVGQYPTAVPDTYGYIQSIPSGKLFSILSPGGLGEEIRDLALDTHRRLWVATHIGLGMWDGERWTTYNAAVSPLPHDDVRAVTVAPDGETIWIGTADGLARLNGETWTTFTHDNSDLSSPVINDLAFDQDGRLWAATSFGGVASYDGEQWSYYDKYNSELLGLSVATLTVGPDGRIWMVDDFGDGVSMFDGQQWEHYNQENSDLGSNWVEQIAVDDEGRVWFASRAELSVLDGETWNPFDLTPVYENFFSPQRLAQEPDGRVWVAGIHPDKITVYSFTALELVTGQTQAYSIPPINIPAGESTLPPAIFLDEQGELVSVYIAEEWAVPAPQALLPTGDGAWLGTSYGLFRLYTDGRVEAVPLPNPQPPPRSSIQPAGNPLVEFLQIYEFHPDHIRVIAVGTIQVWNSYTPSTCSTSSGPDLYNPHDVTEFVVSENMTICEGANLNCSFRPVEPPDMGERFTYWMSEIVHRLPHLHTPNPIEPEQAYHFGARAPQPQEDAHWIRVLALPISADILDVEENGSPPTAEVIVDDWRLFVYDLRETNRPHVNFVLHDDMPAPSLESYLNAVGWQVGDPAE